MVYNKNEVFEKLEENSDSIEKFGVKRIGVFGSVARNQADKDSDIDFLVEFKETEKSFRNFTDLKDFLEELFETEVDLATERSLKNSIKERVEKEVTYA